MTGSKRARSGEARGQTGGEATLDGAWQMINFLTHHGLPLLFAVVLLESFGMPLPGESALIAFAVLASQGHYPIALVIAVTAVAAIVGDNLGVMSKRITSALASRPSARATLPVTLVA